MLWQTGLYYLQKTPEIHIESERSVPLTVLLRSFCLGISSGRGSGFLFLCCGVGVLVACKLGPSALLWHASSHAKVR